MFEATPLSSRIVQIQKRDGRLVKFDPVKIADAIFKAAIAAGGEDRYVAEELSGVVGVYLEEYFVDRAPTIEDIQDVVEKVLIETNHADTAKAYILYRESRSRARSAIRIRDNVSNADGVTPMVSTSSEPNLHTWDKVQIIEALSKEADVDAELAGVIASRVERRIFDSKLTIISTSLVRALVDNELFDFGHATVLEKQRILGLPKYDVQQWLTPAAVKDGAAESVPIWLQTQTVERQIAGRVVQQYALEDLYSENVARAHLEGTMHIHGLGFPTQAASAQHCLENLKRNGLNDPGLKTVSAPAKHTATLTGHVSTWLNIYQARYLEALSLNSLNIAYAPFIASLFDEEVLQEAQNLIFSMAQHPMVNQASGALEFHLHGGISAQWRDVLAIGPGGVVGPKTYADHGEHACRLAKAMLSVWREGDRNGKRFAEPLCAFHVDEQLMGAAASDASGGENSVGRALLEQACDVALTQGGMHFVFDAQATQESIVLSQCTINLAVCAKRAGSGNWAELKSLLAAQVDLAAQAFEQKRNFYMAWYDQAHEAVDAEALLESLSGEIGIVGLQTCLQSLLNCELYDDGPGQSLALQIVEFLSKAIASVADSRSLPLSLAALPSAELYKRFADQSVCHVPAAAVAGDDVLDARVSLEGPLYAHFEKSCMTIDRDQLSSLTPSSLADVLLTIKQGEQLTLLVIN